MDQNRRVVVTGMGIISPLGCGLTASWQGAKEGKCGIGPITLYDTEGQKVKLAGEAHGFDAENYIPQQNTGSYIGAEKAKSVALAHVGVNQSQVTRLRCELEKDDGRWEYQVEFCYGTMEYEYEIDAYTGAILSRDMESIYD